ncbi:MAG TPA: L,D-transpeptidase family protein [Rhodocyclaceae bacterium]|nr:L,D-transpeptidase family protein [Rhodocyclaceae bacterium]
MRKLAISAGIGILLASYFFGSEVLGNKLSQPAVAAVQQGEPLPLLKLTPNASPEAQLAEVFARIERNQLDQALQQAEVLTERYPNFRLGQLVKGDLLLARAQAISTFGNASNAPQDKLADLRAEAMARLNAYRSRPPADMIPSNLLQLEPEQKFAVVVEAQRSRLYLYANDNGVPKLVSDYYITQGKLGADKMREGDKKTPIGVYKVVGNLSRAKIGDFYGSGAWPLNYPNDLDRRMGRNGHGIWLHGTPSDTYSRPPKASDGCVVLANPDLDAVATHLQIGLTPVIITQNIDWLNRDEWRQERDDLRAAVDDWRKDWESRDGERYARNYSRKFEADGTDYASWVDQKRKINAAKSWISVDTEKLSMFRYPGKQDMAVVTFQQDYKSNNLSNTMMKRQYWIKEDGHWKIIYEGAA